MGRLGTDYRLRGVDYRTPAQVRCRVLRIHRLEWIAVRSRWAMSKQKRGRDKDAPMEWQLSLPKRNYSAEVKPLALILETAAGLRWRG